MLIPVIVNFNIKKVYIGVGYEQGISLGQKETYSDGYDIAQEVILFLCNHIGKKLGDLELDYKGKKASIKTLAMRVVFSYLDKVLRKDNRCKPYSRQRF